MPTSPILRVDMTGELVENSAEDGQQQPSASGSAVNEGNNKLRMTKRAELDKEAK